MTATFRKRTFEVARYCLRKRLNEDDVNVEEWQNALRRGDPWLGKITEGPEAAQDSAEVGNMPSDLVDAEAYQPT